MRATRTLSTCKGALVAALARSRTDAADAGLYVSQKGRPWPDSDVQPDSLELSLGTIRAGHTSSRGTPVASCLGLLCRTLI
uniref:Uncharacterized protein n=1 Tax=Ralstonia solanacearum TaxID=305 RepID=A0A0S4TY02_RALSL|nr:exported protein of unknown function [Ralstonia solanacearum]